jgi:TatA/E family protein of Tat protein translocase
VPVGVSLEEGVQSEFVDEGGGVYMGDGLFQPLHLFMILGIALLVFGPKRLPELGKGLGEAIRGFKTSMKEIESTPSIDQKPVGQLGDGDKTQTGV